MITVVFVGAVKLTGVRRCRDPEGIKAISRWLSVATPPETKMDDHRSWKDRSSLGCDPFRISNGVLRDIRW